MREEVSFESAIADCSESFFLEIVEASRLNFLLADGLLDRFLDLADLISESVTLSLNRLKRWL